MKIIIVASVVCLAALGFAAITPPIPVPSAPYGLRYPIGGPTTPNVTVEIFIDLTCPDSMNAWPILKNVQSHYGANQLGVIVQQLPLPYHRNTFLSTQGLYVIVDQVPSQVFSYIEDILAHNGQLSTGSTANMTDYDVVDYLSVLANESTGIDKQVFKNRINLKRSYTAAAWKFGVERLVSSTPTFFVNGVDLAVGNNFPTYNDWIRFLDTIL